MTAPAAPDVLVSMTSADREAELLVERAVVERWSSFALLRVRSSIDDDELWSIRDGRLARCVDQRLPGSRRDAFDAAHRRMEDRLWTALVASARRCAELEDGLRATTGVTKQEGAARELSAARQGLARAHRSYARSAAPPRPAIEAAVRGHVMESWHAGGQRCGICGQAVLADEPTAVDHILPVSHGGRDEAANLRVAHARCNIRRGAAYSAGDQTLADIRLSLERPHPSLSALFGCWLCGVPTRGYVDLPNLPTLRFCPAHRGWDTVRPLLAGFGLGEDVLDRVQYAVDVED